MFERAFQIGDRHADGGPIDGELESLCLLALALSDLLLRQNGCHIAQTDQQPPGPVPFGIEVPADDSDHRDGPTILVQDVEHAILFTVRHPFTAVRGCPVVGV